MPTYEYVCQKCGHEFEAFQRITAEPLKTCLEDSCGQKKWGRGRVVKKISAGAGLLFKGSGFYITDYRSENYKQSAKSATGETKSAEAKPAAAAEKPAAEKPAAKAEAKPAAKPTPKAGKK